MRHARGTVRGRRLVLVGAAVVLAAACSGRSAGGVDAAQQRVTTAQQAVDDAEASLTQAQSDFCVQTKDYILAIDRYGKLFTDAAATVGDVRTLGADLAAPRESTAAAAQAVVTAHDALNAAN